MLAKAKASGLSEHDSHDAVQGFVADVLLERNLSGSADPDRGRFRGLLSQSLSNYLRDRHRHDRAAKRHPTTGRVLSIETADQSATNRPIDPESAFTRHWVATVLRNSVKRVRDDFESGGREIEWRVLEARLIRPMIDGASPVPYQALVEELQLRGLPQAAAYLVNGKRALGRAILDEIGHTVRDPALVEDEIRELLQLLETSNR
ncbi:MAG: hypothetical protein CMJ22_12415 [Phycisphaerae bacterium]|nr:hypothetical protein [Phycisphaerae bacterium]